MRKRIFSCMLIALMVFTGAVLPVQAYTNAEWKYDGYGSVTEVSGTVLNLKGNETATDGQFYGPYAKPTVEFNADKPIKEEFNIELKADKYSHGELFDLSVSLDDVDKNYVTEFRTLTQKVGDKFVITSSFDNNFNVEVSQDGVYTYRYEAYFKEGKVMAKFTLLFYDEVVATTAEIDLDTITVEANKPVADKVVAVRSFWFDSISAREGVNLYSELPYVELTMSFAGVEEVVNYPLGYAMTEEEVEELIKQMTAELAASGVTFKGFYANAELTEKFDWTKPMNVNTIVYIDAEEATPEEPTPEEPKVPEKENPNTSDINLILILSTLLIGGTGLGFTLKNRKFN